MSSGNKTICIIGGGVAGLLAAVTAADEGASVKLFEKMSKVGLKMGITGKGRCNLTNSAPIMDFIAKTPGNGKFLYSAYENSIMKTFWTCFTAGASRRKWNAAEEYFQQAMMRRKSVIFSWTF